LSKTDNIKHPKHYTRGIEMWEYAHSQDLDFFEGNIIKYVTRWKDKNGIEDAKVIEDEVMEEEITSIPWNVHKEFNKIMAEKEL